MQSNRSKMQIAMAQHNTADKHNEISTSEVVINVRIHRNTKHRCIQHNCLFSNQKVSTHNNRNTFFYMRALQKFRLHYFFVFFGYVHLPAVREGRFLLCLLYLGTHKMYPLCIFYPLSYFILTNMPPVTDIFQLLIKHLEKKNP